MTDSFEHGFTTACWVIALAVGLLAIGLIAGWQLHVIWLGRGAV